MRLRREYGRMANIMTDTLPPDTPPDERQMAIDAAIAAGARKADIEQQKDGSWMLTIEWP